MKLNRLLHRFICTMLGHRTATVRTVRLNAPWLVTEQACTRCGQAFVAMPNGIGCIDPAPRRVAVAGLPSGVTGVSFEDIRRRGSSMAKETTGPELTALLEAHGARLHADLPPDVCYVLILGSGRMRTAESDLEDSDALRLTRDIAQDMASDAARVQPKNQGGESN